MPLLLWQFPRFYMEEQVTKPQAVETEIIAVVAESV
jgi:hypothetical protein